MFGHWVVLQVTATWWSVTRVTLQPPRGLWQQCPCEVPAPWHLRQCHQFCPRPSPCRLPWPLVQSREPPQQPSSAFYTQSLEPALTSQWVWFLLSISVLAPVARAHWRLAHQVLVCACQIWGLKLVWQLQLSSCVLRKTCETRPSV